jgi:hypothetical protein
VAKLHVGKDTMELYSWQVGGMDRGRQCDGVDSSRRLF